MSGVTEARPLPPAYADPDRGPRRTVAAMVAVVVLFVLVAGVWAQFALLDVAVQARGAVVPPSRLQEVTSLEGGIVKEMLVVPGQVVRKGELLARLSATGQELGIEPESVESDAEIGGRTDLKPRME